MPYIGKSPVGGGFHKLDNLTASATDTYALTLGSAAYYPETANQLLVSLNGVIQAPQDSFTVSGSNLVFDSALTASDSIDFVVALGDVLGVGSVSDGAVTTAKIGNGAVTTAKIADDAVTSAKLPAGTVLQVKTAQKTDKESFSGSSFQAISDLSISITPSSTSSEILVMVSLAFGCSNAERIGFTAFRGSTNLSNHSSTLGSRRASFFGFVPTNSNDLCNAHFSTLDSPSTTSATTYSVSGIVTNSATGYINSTFTDTDGSNVHRGVSSITVMEIAG